MKIKNKYKIIFILPLIFLSFAFLHDYFVSITTIDYSKEDKELRTTIKFTAHDLEEEIFHLYHIDLNIGEQTQFSKMDSLLNVYLADYFQVKADKTIVKWNYLGSEFNLDETFYVYLTASANQEPESLYIQNSLLINTFSAQENIVNINLWETKRAFSFTKKTTSNNFTKPINLENQ